VEKWVYGKIVQRSINFAIDWDRWKNDQQRRRKKEEDKLWRLKKLRNVEPSSSKEIDWTWKFQGVMVIIIWWISQSRLFGNHDSKQLSDIVWSTDISGDNQNYFTSLFHNFKQRPQTRTKNSLTCHLASKTVSESIWSDVSGKVNEVMWCVQKSKLPTRGSHSISVPTCIIRWAKSPL
jgi:hypothetical protein